MNLITKLLRKFFVKTKKAPILFGDYKVLLPKNTAAVSQRWLREQLNNGYVTLYSGPVPKHNITTKNSVIGTGKGLSLSLNNKDVIFLDKVQLVNVFCAGVVSFVVLSPKSRRLPRVIIPVHGSENDRVQFSVTNAVAGDDVYITRLEL